MAPRRRSSRLRSATPGKLNNYVTSQLGSLTEGDETSEADPNMDTNLVSSPAPKTPVTASRIQPSPEEMHPSKAHQSTAQEPDSGLRLGFSDIGASGINQLSRHSQRTPSKIVVSDPFPEIKITHPSLDYSTEAQKMIEEHQEKALENKAKLMSEKEKKQTVVESDDRKNGRKLAHPKGKAGRFSDIHMAEFRKMDSIAGHPSAFRAQSSQQSSGRINLKRSPTKAQLDECEPKTKKRSGLDKNGHGDHAVRLDKSLPSERVRNYVTDDASTCQTVSGHSQTPFAPKRLYPPSKTPPAITTPGKTFVARSCVKKSASQIPRFSKSPFKSTLSNASRSLTKSGPTKCLSGIPISSKVAGSPIKLERSKTNIEFLESTSKFMKNPSTPFIAGNPKLNKTVNFTPKTIRKHAAAALNSPSPIKSSIPKSNLDMNSGAQTTIGESSNVNSDASRILFPSTAPIRDPGTPRRVEYPSIPGIHSLPQASLLASSQLRSPSSPPKSLTYQTDQPIKFSSHTKDSDLSLGQTSHHNFNLNAPPGGFQANDEGKNSLLPSIPHGMSNKRRRRPDSDEERDEMVRSSKKLKSNTAKILTPKLRHTNRSPGKIPSPAKKPSEGKSTVKHSELDNRGIELESIPLCRACQKEMEGLQKEQILEKSRLSVTQFDGGLSRHRAQMLEMSRTLDSAKADCQKYETLSKVAASNSSKDIGHQRDNPIYTQLSTLDSKIVREDFGENNLQSHEKKKLEKGPVPNTSEPLKTNIYLSIFDPLGEPAFVPSKTKPLPKWMQLLPMTVYNDRERRAQASKMVGDNGSDFAGSANMPIDEREKFCTKGSQALDSSHDASIEQRPSSSGKKNPCLTTPDMVYSKSSGCSLLKSASASRTPSPILCKQGLQRNTSHYPSNITSIQSHKLPLESYRPFQK
ncbi:hypothetical protein K3495_g7578 [Podosphaera aphanis]|nr:hypothetical protein K3495_g7578 [Podosphaera aphanis]